MSTQEPVKKTNIQNMKSERNAPVESTMQFTPRRFSVRGLRKHTGIKTSRTPRVAY